MLYFNDSEIRQYAERYRSHPVLGPATLFLKAFQEHINTISDGWAYWKPPVKASEKLMRLIQNPQRATDEAFKVALIPIKSFCTRYAKDGVRMPPIPGSDTMQKNRERLNEDVRQLTVAANSLGHEMGPAREIPSKPGDRITVLLPCMKCAYHIEVAYTGRDTVRAEHEAPSLECCHLK